MNTVLAGTAYTPSPDSFGDVSVTLTVDDNGNKGVGGPLTHSKTFTVKVAPVNDPPVLRVPHATHSVEEDGSLVVTGVSFTDKDEHVGLHRVTVEVARTLEGGGKDVGVVMVKNGAGIKWIEGSSSGSQKLEFVGSLETVKDSLDEITYEPGSDFNLANGGVVELTVTVSDMRGGTSDSGMATMNVYVTPVNDVATVAFLDAGDSGQRTVVEDEVLSLAGIAVLDIDAGEGGTSNVVELTVTATNGIVEAASFPIPGIFVVTNETLGAENTVVARGGVDDINEALLEGRIRWRGMENFWGDGKISVSVDDMGNSGSQSSSTSPSSPLTLLLAVTAVNDAPTITIPTSHSFTVPEDGILSLEGITVADGDFSDPQLPAEVRMDEKSISTTN